ncbi:MAG: TonB-dependent receptor [Breznakibacter sp.]
MNNEIRYIFGFWLYFGFSTIANLPLAAQTTFKLSGMVCDSTTRSPLEMVAVVMPEINRWCLTNDKGYFEINALPPGEYELEFQLLGYQQQRMTVGVGDEGFITAFLSENSLKLNEVRVTASENKMGATASVIDAAAMAHLQPSSFGDLLELLPGHSARKSDMASVPSIALRQAGSDVNTAFGTAFIVDGVPLSNDANHQYTHGSSGDLKISNRINVRNGMDMRQMSTDDVARIEVIRGIPSVKYGDLLSGAVVIHPKTGVSPWEGRVKADLNTKLFSVGKGFRLNSHSVLNGSVEVLDYVSDPRTQYDNYQRITGSVRFTSNRSGDHWRLYSKASLSVLGTLDQSKNEPELNYGQQNDYRSSLTRMQGGFEQKLLFGANQNQQLELKGALTYAMDELTRVRRVSLTGPTPMGTNSQPGKYEGIYLPSTYLAHLRIEGQPMNVFINAQYAADLSLAGLVNHLDAGLEWKLDKNYGAGEQYDQSRPPFPGASYQLPRAFHSIPAMHKLSAYLNDQFNFKFDRAKLAVEAGVRLIAMPGLNQQYAIHGRVYADPRLNARLDLPEVMMPGGLVMKSALRFGYGRLTRMPSASHLYPASVYNNVMELNYYSQNPDLRKLYIATFQYDPINYDLQPARNDKYELGVDLRMAKAQLQMTWFHEWCGNGFSSETVLQPYSYNDYDESSVKPDGLTAPPDLSLFEYDEVYKTMMLGRFGNLAETTKQGLEYALSFPEIKAIRTAISLNGAWFRTHYRQRGQGYDRPSVVINNQDYPYVAVYASALNENRVRQQFNTNLLFSLHVPRYRLLGTISIQNMWYTSTKPDAVDGIPVAYVDQFGNHHPFTQEMAADPMMSYMVKKYPDKYFLTTKVPFESTVNMKLSKEIGDKMKISFYVNNLFCYEPDYMSNYGVTIQRLSVPYFGMELNLKL